MVGVMVMTPVHMGHAGGSEGTTLRVIGLVISVHVAGMYLFSPLVGLAGRPGRPDGDGRRRRRASCSPPRRWPAPPRRERPLQLGAGLLLLGLGWSCGLIAGSTLVTESVVGGAAADGAGRHATC